MYQNVFVALLRGGAHSANMVVGDKASVLTSVLVHRHSSVIRDGVWASATYLG